MKKLTGMIFLVLASCASRDKMSTAQADLSLLATDMENSIKHDILERWYPLAVDTSYGGFLTEFTYDFKPTDNQRKMIVTQARHTWTNARAAMRYRDEQSFKDNARHGFRFLRDVMWDKEHGGFYTLVTREGQPIDPEQGKTAYGNAFAIYALAAYYDQSRDPEALAFVQTAFQWLDSRAHDQALGGYYQHLSRSGEPVRRQKSTPSTSDLGYKDQNSSIHLLEAFTELYQVWTDSVVWDRLQEMQVLIRDRIVTSKGYLTLFLTPDFQPVSFRDSTKEIIEKHHYLDHVSFGHDVETAFLLLEASHVLGLEDDTVTRRIAKKMVDHALDNGWDEESGGFFDEAYYFRDSEKIAVTVDTKNWWAQAEGMNTLLMMGELYPDDPRNYLAKGIMLWKYIDRYLIDHENGDWYAGAIDRQPELKTALKGQIWKANYHQFRAMSNSVDRLRKIGN